MSLDWKTVELKSIANVTMGQSPKSKFYNDNSEGMPFLQGNKTFGDKYPSFELYTTSIKKVAEKNSVLMSVRAPVGDLNIAQEDICIGRGVCGLKMKKGDNEFLYYLLKANISHLINKESGTVFGSINKNDIETFEVTLPEDYEDQIKILTILKNIDKKIEVCKNLNKNLEQLLNTIFNYWFISFDKFKNVPLKQSRLGNIPEGWDCAALRDLLTLTKNPIKSDETNGLPYLPIDIIPMNSLGISELKSDEEANSSLITFNKNDILIGAMRVYFHRVVISPCSGVTRSTCFVLKPKNEHHLSYLLLLCNLDRTIQYAQNTSKGTTMPYAVWDNGLGDMNIIMPPEDILLEFHELVFPIIENIRDSYLEINKLSKLRDTLLPKLMSGEVDVSKINYDLTLRIMKFILNPLNYINRGINMKTKIISKIQNQMKEYLNPDQYIKLTNSLLNSLQDVDIIDNNNELCEKDNFKLLDLFLSAKQVEGRSPKTITYYKSTIEKMLVKIKKQIYNINTDDLRKYLFDHKNEKQSSKTTIDNIRRILSSFFSWLEDEDYILKNPVRRIHKVKTGRTVKEVLTDENLETLRDKCDEIRDLAMLELLISTGIRVGELVRLNISDIDFYERECVVFGKGESERIVYFDARTKIHLMQYIQQRTDENPALFVSLNKPNTRLGISGIETRLRELGEKCNIKKVHPHKFRRTMATNAIDKGMPIEQVQKLLGHVQIDTTMQYAMVNQSNVKHAHRKFIG